MDNYPAGAANDPQAPYNQPVDEHVEVEVKSQLSKTANIFKKDVDYWKSQRLNTNDALQDAYTSEYRTPEEALVACGKVLKQLIKEGRTVIAGYGLQDLLIDCDNWSTDLLEFTEV